MSTITPLKSRYLDPDEGVSYLVRPMRAVDLEGVMQVERAGYEYPWTEGVFRDCLRVGYCCWLLLRRDGGDNTFIGHGIASVAAMESHLLNLCIAPVAQRRGLGQAMLLHMLRVVQRHGALETFLEVRPSNQAARNLYARVGFKQVGMRKAYYPGPGVREDALVLSVQLRSVNFSQADRTHKHVVEAGHG